jgi:hypothetical protein
MEGLRLRVPRLVPQGLMASWRRRLNDLADMVVWYVFWLGGGASLLWIFGRALDRLR